MIRLVVTGGRDFTDAGLVDRALGAVHRKHGVSVLIEGGQVTFDPFSDDRWGADFLCKQWAEANGIEVAEYLADWDNLSSFGAIVKINSAGRRYNLKAGFDRNQRMIDEGKPDFAVAFPGGRGTWDMIERLKEAQIETWIVGGALDRPAK